ncbi:hypothetical protein [Leptolyngbya sp. PCC 6406]|uniref:hypothetical protein n=1 Tax=Leptolyngbya sp. PCC 6406 TaxID=1173264 RepID=UPI0002ABC059|nr:hypothetical protein [Leptolyngbya sp. PCC 6406]
MTRRKHRRPLRQLPPGVSQGVLVGLLGLDIALVVGVIWFCWRYEESLQVRNLDRLAWSITVLLALTAGSVAMQLLQWGKRSTPWELVTRFLWGWAWGLGVTIGVISLLSLMILPLLLPRVFSQEFWLLIWLAVVLPTVVLPIVDLCQGTYARTLPNLGWLMAKYLFHFCLINVLLITVAIAAFALFPAGLMIQFLSGIDLLVRWAGATSGDSLPLFCSWLQTAPRYCGGVLVGFHLGHPLLAILAVCYWEPCFNWCVDSYQRVVEWISDRIHP